MTRTKNLGHGQPFALGGDSGSVVYSNDGSPIGLVVAVNKELGRTYACEAINIEEILRISFTPLKHSSLLKVQYDNTTLPNDPKDRFDILVAGISIGHGLVSAGTLGAFVWDKETGELMALTCAHVAAPPGAKVGDPIYQPGPLDIREKFRREPNDADIAGHLVRWCEISSSKVNKIDAAIFRPMRPVWPDYLPGGGRRPLKRPRRPRTRNKRGSKISYRI